MSGHELATQHIENVSKYIDFQPFSACDKAIQWQWQFSIDLMYSGPFFPNMVLKIGPLVGFEKEIFTFFVFACVAHSYNHVLDIYEMQRRLHCRCTSACWFSVTSGDSV